MKFIFLMYIKFQMAKDGKNAYTRNRHKAKYPYPTFICRQATCYACSSISDPAQSFIKKICCHVYEYNKKNGGNNFGNRTINDNCFFLILLLILENKILIILKNRVVVSTYPYKFLWSIHFIHFWYNVSKWTDVAQEALLHRKSTKP